MRHDSGRTTPDIDPSALLSPEPTEDDVPPIHELGCVLVLTHVLAAPLPGATAIEELRRAAQHVGWHPVGDVLRVASERCLARGHLRLDNRQYLVLTEPGRHWLIAIMSLNGADLPSACAEMFLACQLAALSQLELKERQRILAAVTARRRDQLQQHRDCEQSCAGARANSSGPHYLHRWHDWAEAQLTADLQRLDALAAAIR